MYQLSIRKDFVAQHYLIVPDCGPENINHSHVYALELLIQGDELDQYGYLVDIDVVKSEMNKVIGRYRDKTLNETPSFLGLNPSVEHFARIVTHELAPALSRPNITRMVVKMWEDAECWASYSLEV